MFKYKDFPDFYENHDPNDVGTIVTGNGENKAKLVLNQDVYWYSMMIDGKVVKNFQPDSYDDFDNFEQYLEYLDNTTIDYYSTEQGALYGKVGIKFTPNYLTKDMPYIFDGATMEINKPQAIMYTTLEMLKEKGIKVNERKLDELGPYALLDLSDQGPEAVLDFLRIDEKDVDSVKDIIEKAKETKFSYELVYPDGFSVSDYDNDEIIAGNYQCPIFMEKEFLGLPMICVGSVYRGTPT